MPHKICSSSVSFPSLPLFHHELIPPDSISHLILDNDMFLPPPCIPGLSSQPVHPVNLITQSFKSNSPLLNSKDHSHSCIQLLSCSFAPICLSLQNHGNWSLFWPILEVFTLPHLFLLASDRNPTFPIGILGVRSESDRNLYQVNAMV